MDLWEQLDWPAFSLTEAPCKKPPGGGRSTSSSLNIEGDAT